ncbi:MAG: nucleoside transporter C-terminal domain-containing protein [Gammaproteobacteria bacterium]|nr:nucleoside transporter C-terminal domain-containing protein [Gammaproteobacteria bacterium]MDP6536832.1 nucleoside transporter C-terminal domain-containing protein [Gammaproteobacteria bacterium]MDP6731410.1 nucleoside transporter C-terminal domain-containing protein [Gammaproteobacteria bacterium]
MSSLQALLGIAVFIALAVAFSEQRRLPHWKLLLAGLGLQFLFALLVFRFNLLQALLNGLNRGVAAIANATEAGTLFIFGYLGGDPANVDYPFSVGDPTATVILAFRILPLILIFTVLSAILWHYRILPWIVHGFSFVLRRSMGVSGAVGVSAAANIFVGMVESPALIRPFIKRLTRSELFVVMSCGMATIAGTVMVLYSVILEGVIDNALGHILTASVISAPAAIMLALIMVPPQQSWGAGESGGDAFDVRTDYHNVMDAIARGTSDGLKLMANVGAMLLVLVALVALLNSALSLIPIPGGEALTLQAMFGWVFAPLVWLMGIPWQEAPLAGSLMGIKTALNELLAFLALADLPAGALSEKSTIIMTYAICGFANFGSLGIMIAGLTGMCSERAQEIVALAPKSLISGTLATCMTGAIAGLLTF